MTRSLVLSFSRFTNQAIVLLSPVLLVRILPVAEYGSYREFMLYAGLIGYLGTFGVTRSLPYLIPKYPEQEREWLTQTVLFLLATSSAIAIGLYFVGDLIRANTSFDFVMALQLYLLFWINLNFMEGYWLAKKRTDYVLYLSTGRLVTRLVVLVAAAALTRDVKVIVWSLIGLEALRCLLVLAYGVKRHWFTRGVAWSGISLQLSYFMPLGIGAIVELLNRQAGLFFISTMIGAEALAFFAIGALATQIVNILRGAVSDVVFPEIMEMKTAAPKDALPLWQKATVLFCVLLFPMAAIFSLYADVVVKVLFTAEYGPAVPVFAVFALLLYLDCFDYHLPLRVQNANRYFVSGNVIALAANAAMLYPAYKLFGLVGPAVALVLSRVVFTVYLGRAASRVYQVPWRGMVPWRQVAKVMVISIVCIPILVAGKYAVDILALRGIVFGSLYLITYLILLRVLGVWDASEILRRALSALQAKRRATRGST